MKETREQAAQRVFESWRVRQRRPELNRYSKQRAKQISAALASGYSADDLILVIRWAHESDEDRPRFLRGENDQGKTYLDLTNLLVVSKLDQRVTWALEWAERASTEAPQEEPSQLRLVGAGGSTVAKVSSPPAAPSHEVRGGRWASARGSV